MVDRNARWQAEDEGYHKALSSRQLQMIAIGGAIGTGLFLGAGQRLAKAGPGLFVVYAVCGVFVYLMLRALGELVLYRPSSGSFVSYGREFFGEKVAFVAGWMYFLFWSMTGIVDTTAIATYFHYWNAFRNIPQWFIALVALSVILGMNLISVGWFGEFEFWASLIKVAALMAFLVIGAIILVGRWDIDGHRAGFGVIAHSGGFTPTGVISLVMVTSGVVFAYAAVELVGTAAGETLNPARIVPRAINAVIARIALFYVGSLALLGVLLPYTDYRAGTSPFVTFFSKLGVHGAGTIMNVVVLTAAFSSLNAGLYSTGRILRSMAIGGTAPSFTGRMSRSGVPYGGIVLTSIVGCCGVGLNAAIPGEAFEIVLNMASLGIVAAWSTIVLCQLELWRRSRRGMLARPSYRLPGAPYTGVATLIFLATVIVLMAVGDDPVQRWTVATLVVIIPALVVGWCTARRKMVSEQRHPIDVA